jgi:hypothetical protein
VGDEEDIVRFNEAAEAVARLDQLLRHWRKGGGPPDLENRERNAFAGSRRSLEVRSALHGRDGPLRRDSLEETASQPGIEGSVEPIEVTARAQLHEAPEPPMVRSLSLNLRRVSDDRQTRRRGMGRDGDDEWGVVVTKHDDLLENGRADAIPGTQTVDPDDILHTGSSVGPVRRPAARQEEVLLSAATDC